MKDVDYRFEQCEVYCDHCDESIMIDNTDYTYINQELKENGWLVRRINGRWYEFCSKECYRNFLKKEGF